MRGGVVVLGLALDPIGKPFATGPVKTRDECMMSVFGCGSSACGRDAAGQYCIGNGAMPCAHLPTSAAGRPAPCRRTGWTDCRFMLPQYEASLHMALLSWADIVGRALAVSKLLAGEH